jgi:hypothetical protein
VPLTARGKPEAESVMAPAGGPSSGGSLFVTLQLGIYLRVFLSRFSGFHPLSPHRLLDSVPALLSQ